MTPYNELNIDVLTKLDENITKNHPNLDYEGFIGYDEDEMDYVTITLKGARIA